MADVRFGSNTNRHNFRLGDDQVDRIYLGDTRVWVNEVNVSITFDNQVADTTIAGTFSIPAGVPGASFSQDFTWTTDDQTLDRFTASDCSLSDNGGGSITCVVTGATTGTNRRTRNIRISGTYPDNDVTSTATFTGTIITLTGSTSCGGGFGSIGQNGGSWSAVNGASFSISFTVDEFSDSQSIVVTSPTYAQQSGTTSVSGTGVSPLLTIVFSTDAGAGSLVSITGVNSIAETATTVACRTEVTRTL